MDISEFLLSFMKRECCCTDGVVRMSTMYACVQSYKSFLIVSYLFHSSHGESQFGVKLFRLWRVLFYATLEL